MTPIALVLPVSTHDVDLFRALLPVLKKFGPYQGHACVLAPTIELAQEANTWKDSLKLQFSAIHICPVNKDGAEGYPIGPNRHFRITSEWIAKNLPQAPWWWFEADCCPVVGNWLQAANKELQQSGKAFMGTVVPTRGWTRDFSGNLKPETRGEHMVGAGIYPGNYAATSLLIRGIDVIRRDLGVAPVTLPFDIALCNEVTPRAHHSKSIQHNWATQAYQKKDGQIVCEPTAAKPEYVRNRPVQPETLVVHGCKDLSLISLILGEEVKVVPVAAPVLEEVPKQAPTPQASSPSADTPPSSPETATIPTPPPRMSFLATRIHTLLKDGKSRKIARIAADLNVTMEQVQAAVQDPQSALEVRGPGWVRPKSDSDEQAKAPEPELQTA